MTRDSPRLAAFLFVEEARFRMFIVREHAEPSIALDAIVCFEVVDDFGVVSQVIVGVRSSPRSLNVIPEAV